MDEAVPAVEGLDVGDTCYVSAVVLVVLKIVLLFKILSLGGVLKGCREVLHTFGITNWLNVYCSGAVDINEHFLVLLGIVSGRVPDWVYHEDILTCVQSDLLVEERESEVGAEASIDEFTVCCHEDDIEFGWIELLPSILFAVVQQAISLLEH